MIGRSWPHARQTHVIMTAVPWTVVPATIAPSAPQKLQAEGRRKLTGLFGTGDRPQLARLVIDQTMVDGSGDAKPIVTGTLARSRG